MARSPVSCSAKCSRITLVTLNIVFLLCGIAFLVLGIIFRWGGQELREDTKVALSEVQVAGYAAYDLFNSAAILFVITGVVIIIISFLGFVGACCTARWALYIYSVLVGLIIAVELAGVILFLIFQGDVDDALKTGLRKSIERANGGGEFAADNQKSMEYIMRTYKCCHVENLRLNNYLNEDTRSKCSYGTPEREEDCFTEIKEWVNQYSIPLIIIGIVVVIVQLFMITFSCCVIRAYRKEELV